MGKIIAFAGRCRSGKTELAKICEDFGYHKLYFALPLKQLCANILSISIDELNYLKNNNIPINLTINEHICNELADNTNISIENTMHTCNGKYIDNVREMLQFIGTDYIRNYNTDWHVDKIKQIINDNTSIDYVIDDVRFQNEKKVIDELGGDTWFVTRTAIDNISNHESETSIRWQDCFNKVIINDGTLSELQFKWRTFMEDYAKSCEIREREFKMMLENGYSDDIDLMSILEILMLPYHLFTYTPKNIDKDEINKITMNEDNTIFIQYNDNTIEMIDNPLIIEDLKMIIK